MNQDNNKVRFSHNDDKVVVIIGSGAGGGTLANELAQKGINVVVLEAGKLHTQADFTTDEWGAFQMLSWLDKRTTSGTWRIAKDFPNLPAWICKTVGGTTVHWAGASLRIRPYEFKAKTTYGDIKDANLLDWPLTREELDPYYDRASQKMGVTRTNGLPGLPGNNNFKVMSAGAMKIGYKECKPATWRSIAWCATTARIASSAASVFRAAARARSGPRSTPNCRARRRPVIWSCARRPTWCALKPMRAARRRRWSTTTTRANCSGRRRVSLRWRAIRSRRRGCC